MMPGNESIQIVATWKEFRILLNIFPYNIRSHSQRVTKWDTTRIRFMRWVKTQGKCVFRLPSSIEEKWRRIQMALLFEWIFLRPCFLWKFKTWIACWFAVNARPRYLYMIEFKRERRGMKNVFFFNKICREWKIYLRPTYSYFIFCRINSLLWLYYNVILYLYFIHRCGVFDMTKWFRSTSGNDFRFENMQRFKNEITSIVRDLLN